jgi:hypothetical protein
MKLLIAATLMAASIAAFASTTVIDTGNLSDSDVAELKAIAAQKAAEKAKQDSPSTLKDVSSVATLAATWGNQAAVAAEGFAKALNIAAKELGVTVNDFLHTDAGRLTAALIIWKVAGTGIVHILFGLLVLVIGLTLARTFYLRLFTEKFVSMDYTLFWGLYKGTKQVRVPKSFHDLDHDGEWLMVWVTLGLTILTILIASACFAI